MRRNTLVFIELVLAMLLCIGIGFGISAMVIAVMDKVIATGMATETKTITLNK
jgi:hypothetical protein